MTAPATDDWLAARIADYLSLTADEIDRGRSLADYGLDSVNAMSLCGEIETTFGLEVEPTLAWEYPTVDAMSEHLDALRREQV